MRTKSERLRASKVRAASKGGRPKAQGVRTPSGQLSRSADGYASRGAKDVALSQPHRVWLAEDLRVEQHAESVLGRLFLAGAISERQCWAGTRLKRVMAEFRSVLASPITPRAAMVSMVAPGIEPAEDHRERQNTRIDAGAEDEIKRHDRVLAEFDESRDALMVDRDAYLAVHSVAVDDRSTDDVGALVRGLDRLVGLYGFEEDKPKKITGHYTEKPCWGRDFREVHFIYDDKHLTNAHKSGSS